MINPTLLAAQLLLTASIASAACSRKTLSLATQNFLSGATSKSNPFNPAGLTLAKDVKISQNNIIVPSLKDTIYFTMTSPASGYKIEASDTVTCDIATLFVMKEGNESAIASLRMRTSQDKITEIEILKASKGSHALFAPESYPASVPAIWQESNRSSTDEGSQFGLSTDLIKIADTYAQALQEGNNTMALAAYACPRLENGNQTTEHCGANMDLFKWPVTDRRWVADSRTGVVMGSFFFHYKDGKGKMSQMGLKDRGPDSKVGLWLHEYFKIDRGKIVAVSAAMKTLGADYKDVWAGK
jgi:hypothetical protein